MGRFNSSTLVLAAAVLVAGTLVAQPAIAADPDGGTVTRKADFAWQGETYLASAVTFAPCPSAAEDPDDVVCDHVVIDVDVDDGFWDKRDGGLVVDITSDSSTADFDLFVYDEDGALVGSSGNPDSEESVTVPSATGTYEVRVKPWLVPEPATYTGTAGLEIDRGGGGGDAGASKRPPPRTQPLDAPDMSDQMWNLDDIRSPAANAIATGEDAVVAVIDTGVDIHHPEFEGRFVDPLSWVCPDGVAVPCKGIEYVDDGQGHGTHVAGTVAAADDGVGVTGVAPDATIMPIRIFDDGGSSVGDSAAAVRYAVERGADVITMSFGFGAAGPVVSNPFVPLDGGWSQAIAEAAAAGALVTMSAGNDFAPYCEKGEFWQDAALCVGAYGPTHDPAVYSAWGAEVDIFAPGGGLLFCDGAIWSTVPLDDDVDFCTGTAGYGVKAGTSMAAPHVAGVGALLVETGITGSQARQQILDTARNAGDPGLAAGLVGPRLDAAAAIGAG